MLCKFSHGNDFRRIALAGHIPKDVGRGAMSRRDYFRTRAAEFHARARNEYDATARHEYENLEKQYLRLAAQAERNELVDWEPPPPKLRH